MVRIEYSGDIFAKFRKLNTGLKKKILSTSNVFYNNDESVLAKSNKFRNRLKTGTLESEGPTLLSGSNFITSGYLKLIEPKIKKEKQNDLQFKTTSMPH